MLRTLAERSAKPACEAISRIIPDKETILFGARNGSAYDGNSRIMYEWFLENRSGVDVVWMTRDDDIYTRLSNRGNPVEKINSVAGVRLLMEASAAGITHRTRDIASHGSLVPSSLKIVHLRNASGFMWDHDYMVKTGKIEGAKERLTEADYLLANSDKEIELELRRTPFAREKYVVTGFPTNDYLLNPPKHVAEQWDQDFGQYDNVILYAPTKRMPFGLDEEFDEPVEFFPFDDFSEEKLISFLENHNGVLLLRPHPTTTERMHSDYSKQYSKLKQFLNQLCENNRVILGDHDAFSSIGYLLPNVDILVSDYSAILFDYLVTEKPVVFVPYDLERFQEELGFIIDDYHSLPGPKVSNFDELIEEFNSIFEGGDDYSEQRSDFSSKIYTYRDGNSCQRIADLLSDDAT